MDHVTRIRTLLKTFAKGAKITLATTLTLAFGATMVWGIVSAFDGKTSIAIALEPTQITGSPENATFVFPALNWCLGNEPYCNENKATRCFYESNTGICHANPSLNIPASEDPCQINHDINTNYIMGGNLLVGITKKTYTNDAGQEIKDWCNGRMGKPNVNDKSDIVTDKRYWCTSQQWDSNANPGEPNEYTMIFVGDQGDVCWDEWSIGGGFVKGCNAPHSGATNPDQLDWDCTYTVVTPASCSNVTIDPAVEVVQPGQSLSYTGAINDGNPRDLKWYKVVNGVEELITDDDNTFTVNAVAPQTGNMSVRLSVNGNNEPACQKAVTVQSQPASCISISGPSGTVQPGQTLSYTGTVNPGNPQNLQWYLDGSAINNATGSSVTITAPTDTNTAHQVRLSVNGDNIPACQKTIEIEDVAHASCVRIDGPEGNVTDSFPLHYDGTVYATGTVPGGINLQWTVSSGSSIQPIGNGQDANIQSLPVGTHVIKLSVNGDDVANCKKTVVVSQPIYSCDRKYSNKDGQVLKPGDELTYYIDYTAENLSNNLTINDRLPEGFVLDNYPDYCGYIYPTDIFFCLSKESGTIALEGHIDPNFTGTSITNHANVKYDSAVGEECNTTTHTIAQPTVSCEDKSASLTSVKIGDTIDYTVTAKLSDVGANELVIVDDFDETKVSIDPTKVSVTPSAEMWTDCSIEDRNGNKVLKCSLRMFENEGFIDANTYVFKYTANILNSVVNGTIDNKVIETYATRNGIRYSDSNTVDSCSNQVTVVEPKLSCNDKSADKVSVKEGDVITYTVSLNLTGTPVDRLAFVDNYDESIVQIIENSWKGDLRISCTDKNGELSCDAYSPLTMVDAIKEGTYTFTYQARVIANVTKVAVNQITSATAIRRSVKFTNDNTEGACTAEVQVRENIPSVDCIEKTVNPSTNVKVGDEIAYSIRYTSLNQDGKVHISDTLNSEYFKFGRFDANSANYCDLSTSGADETVSCDVPENIGGTITFYVRVLKAGTKLNNTATVSGDNKSDTCSVPVDTRERIKSLECVSKVANDSSLNWNENVTFTITYKNTGETTLDGVKLIDTMPIGMEFVSSKDNACEKKIASPGSGDIVACSTDQDLEVGKTATFEITAKVTKKDGGVLTNRITRIESEGVTGDTTKCDANVAVGLPEPKVSVTKEVDSPHDKTVTLGADAETDNDYVTYKLVVTNEGPTKLVVVPLFDKFNSLDYKFIEATPKETSVTTTNATTIIYWQNLGALNPGESKSIKVTLQALETYWDYVDKNELPNYAVVKDVIDENGVEANEDKDEDSITIEGSILGEELNFTIDKSLISENPTKGGKLVTFKIVVTNVGTKEISEIKFTDTYDVNYLTFSDFSNDISHLQSLYAIDAVNGIFVHNDLLHGYGDEKLDPNEKVEFTVTFVAKDKNGETVNWAKAVVKDMTREDFAKVKVVVETLAKTGANIMIPVAIGLVMAAILGKKVLVKTKQK